MQQPWQAEEPRAQNEEEEGWGQEQRAWIVPPSEEGAQQDPELENWDTSSTVPPSFKDLVEMIHNATHKIFDNIREEEELAHPDFD